MLKSCPPKANNKYFNIHYSSMVEIPEFKSVANLIHFEIALSKKYSINKNYDKKLTAIALLQYITIPLRISNKTKSK